jgi:hypothetical protein
MQNTIIEISNVDKNNFSSDNNNRVVKIKKTIIL